MPRPKFSDRKVQEQLARRVQAVRLERGWTREQLAGALDLAVQTVWKYETARLPVSVTMVYRIAATLGLPVAALIEEAGPTRAEAELVAVWRLLDAKEQEMVLHLARRLSGGGSSKSSAEPSP